MPKSQQNLFGVLQMFLQFESMSLFEFDCSSFTELFANSSVDLFTICVSGGSGNVF